MGRSATIRLSDEQRQLWGLPQDDDTPGQYIVELNVMHRNTLSGARDAFFALYRRVVGSDAEGERMPVPVSQSYFSCAISTREQRELVRLDRQQAPPDRCIYRIWPDFEVRPLMDLSISTIKADAAHRSYMATGTGITWAVIDSGIDAQHPHFQNPAYQTLQEETVAGLHRDFTGPVGPDSPGPETRDSALTDVFGHGTHVAGIIAGGIGWAPADLPLHVFERVVDADSDGPSPAGYFEPRAVSDRSLITGVAPACRLVSLKVLDNRGVGRASNVMRALQYIREQVNADPKVMRIHGVNLSVGYEFNAEIFACGQSPLCVEVDRLVRSGVVVVVAAGNTGYGTIAAKDRPWAKAGIPDTINDPGNAERAITVGATHRSMPHRYGVSFFSSKGPTGDGRLKPDLVAPGERIFSCAAGSFLQEVQQQLQAQPAAVAPAQGSQGPAAAQGGQEAPPAAAGAVYVDHSGTSMAAPHVSGAIAAFLSIRGEFIQRPEEVKRIFLNSATSLGRERYYEGHGLVDLMRAIQSV